MRIKNHRYEGATYRAAKSFGGSITPEIVILHDTAGRLTKGNSAEYLRGSPGGTSVHFIVERDGSVEQQVPTNRRAGHAGKSSYHGRSDCNGLSIGIEIVNPGRMDPVAGQTNVGRAWWGQLLQGDRPGDVVSLTTPEHGSGAWMSYTEEQIVAVDTLLAALFAGIPTLYDIRTHWYVSPGRKVDTNPLFPLDQVRARILGRDDDEPADLIAEARSEPLPTSAAVRIRAASGLNMRRWPSFNPNVIRAIPDGTVVPVMRAGEFDGRAWSLVLFDGQEGWIVDAYTQPA